MSMVGFPLLLIPLAIYNILVFLMPGVSLAEPIVKLSLMSGVEWPLTLGDMLLALGIVLLLFEVIKGARPGAKYLTDHLLSLIVFGAAVAEFLLWPRFGTSVYFLLTLLAVVDFLSGIALRTRRALPVRSDVAVSRRGVPDAPVSEPRFDPAPAPSVPAATSVAESVLLDRPQPKIVPTDTPGESSRESLNGSSPEVVASPGLQPGNGSLPSETPPR